MTIQQAIEKATENGWQDRGFANIKKSEFETVLDREFWIALGKAMGWKTIKDLERGQYIHPDTQPEWLYHWHRFIDSLAAGKTAEDFFANLEPKE